MNDRYPCPACDRPVYAHAQLCPGCQTDLASVALLSEAADVCFNRALAAATQGTLPEAVRQAGACLSLRMTDAAAWVLLGKVFARLGGWKEATLCFQMAYADPRSAGLMNACIAAQAAAKSQLSAPGSPPAGRASNEIDQMLADLGELPGQ